MNYILERLKEKTTYAGIFGILAGFGIAIKPELATALTALGLAIAGTVSVFTKETK